MIFITLAAFSFVEWMFFAQRFLHTIFSYLACLFQPSNQAHRGQFPNFQTFFCVHPMMQQIIEQKNKKKFSKVYDSNSSIFELMKNGLKFECIL